ncbi:hypothetical protein BG004_008336 [Podila humilis]|nr:hypothetical protein BG004_008336 [Podila humilis]
MPLRVPFSPDPYRVVTWTDSGNIATIGKDVTKDVTAMIEWYGKTSMTRPDIAGSPEFRLYVKHHQDGFKAKLAARPQARAAVAADPETAAVQTSSLGSPASVLEFASPRLFLILPSEKWNNRDRSKQLFRLYYLCECGNSPGQVSHVHLSNHPGYILNQHQEFLQQFGHFTLALLDAAKNGHSVGDYIIPALDTFDILNSCQDIPVRHNLTRENFGSLLDKSIASLHRLQLQEPQPKSWSKYFTGLATACVQREQTIKPWSECKKVDGLMSRRIQPFLQIPEGDNGLGGLYRAMISSKTRWLCEDHMLERARVTPLVNFVHSQGGTIDLQRAKISIDLSSLQHVTIFSAALMYSNHTFDLTLRLTWGLSKKELGVVFEQLLKCPTICYHISGDSLLCLNQNPQEYSNDIIAQHMGRNIQETGQIVALANYPREKSHYMYFSIDGYQIFGLVFDNMDRCMVGIDWVILKDKLEKFGSSLWGIDSYDASFLQKMFSALSIIVAPLIAAGLQGIDFFDPTKKTLYFRLGIKDGEICGIEELHLPLEAFGIPVKEFPYLQRVVMRPNMPSAVKVLDIVKSSSPKLHSADLPSLEHEVFDTIKAILGLWVDSSPKIEVTLFEHNHGLDGRPLTTLKFWSARSTDGLTSMLNIINWTFTHISRELKDWDTVVLELATRFSSTAITSLGMDVSSLTKRGLKTMQKVLQQAELEQLCIECVSLDSTLYHPVGLVLGAIQWSSIVTLAIAGSNVDNWLQIWEGQPNPFETPDRSLVDQALSALTAFTTSSSDGDLANVIRLWDTQRNQGSGFMSFSPHLKSLTVHCTRSVRSSHQPLSHRSVLFLHKVIYSCPLEEIQLVNVELKQVRDWDLILEAVNTSEPEKRVFIRCNNPM